MNKEIMNIIAPEYVDCVENEICPLCFKEIDYENFESELEQKEFAISGMCGDCQRKFFTKKK